MSFDSRYVYTGSWINHSFGSARGCTLTLGKNYADALVSLLAIFTYIVGTKLWKIANMSFFLLDSKRKTTVAELQDQTNFRNSDSAMTAVIGILELFFARRSTKGNGFLLNVLSTIWAVLKSYSVRVSTALTFTLGFLVVGAVVSQMIAAPHQEVLYFGNQCGQFKYGGGNVADSSTEDATTMLLDETYRAADYVRYCYGIPSTSSQCDTYVKQDIKWSINTSSQCPFEDNICTRPALLLDTGYVDSLRDLGINSEKSDRVLYRRLTTCAPLNVSERVEALVSGNLPYYAYHLGTLNGLPAITNSLSLNGTDDITALYSSLLAEAGAVPYLLGALVNEAQSPSSSTWEPIPALQSSNADITLFGLEMNMAAFTGPVHDPLFEATNPLRVGNVTLYQVEKKLDQFIHFVACTDQHQLCEPNNSKSSCLDPNGWFPLNASINAKVWKTPEQRAVASRIQQLLLKSSMYYSVAGRDSAALLAHEKLNQRISPPLPDDQWIIEMSNMFATSLARFQHSLVDYTTVAKFSDSLDFTVPQTKEDRALCYTQKVRNRGVFTNISILSLSLILGFGSFFIILGLLIEKSFTFMDPKGSRRLGWTLLGIQQLLRIVLQHDGIGPWERYEKTAPVLLSHPPEDIMLPDGYDNPVFTTITNAASTPTTPPTPATPDPAAGQGGSQQNLGQTASAPLAQTLPQGATPPATPPTPQVNTATGSPPPSAP